MATITISVPEQLRLFVQEQVRTGGYGNVSEYFRCLVREQQKRDARDQVEAMLVEGLASGAPLEGDAKFWEDLRSEANRLASRRKSA